VVLHVFTLVGGRFRLAAATDLRSACPTPPPAGALPAWPPRPARARHAFTARASSTRSTDLPFRRHGDGTR